MGSKHCAECGHRCASERARFCEQCGSALTPIAAPLRAPDPLARKILSGRAGIEGERKQVTVMFTDIVGSMELTRVLDTERWGLVLDRFLAIAAAAVHEFEGTVNQFTGDGLMAVFGAPVAHEDHARRACLAVLRLQRDASQLAEELAGTDRVGFAIRCGLNSGEVIVGSIGDDLHMDFAPIGNTTALGKRMESLAPVGSTAISASTAALVEGEFELRELGEFEVKGAGAPQRVLELVGPGVATSRLQALAAIRGLSRFVGRDGERAALEAALERTLAGDGGAVGIVGEPGVGKSRLVREFVSGCAARGLTINSASCVAHGRFVPFLTALAMYRDYFGVGERDTAEFARERIESTMLALDPAFEADVALLFDFLGVTDPDRPLGPLDPEARQRQLLALVTRTVKARSRHEAAVMVVEDLHWIDDASAAFLEVLIEAVVGTRTLLLTTYRPEHDVTWTRNDPHTQIALAPLDAQAADELLAELLGCDPSLDGLAELITARTGGNPFFIEEVVQALAETGHLAGARREYRLAAVLEDVVLPPTVQAVLAARIDRLPAREKALVQTMSVIGKEIPGALLGEVSDLGDGELAQAVAVLARAEMVTAPTVNDSIEYVFKHPLTQEVAYASQLSQRRARTHQAVAAAIERTYPDGLDERAALLAHHCEAAGDKLEATGWHARAASWAAVTSPADGMRHWRRVRHLTSGLDASPAVDELATKARIGILGLAWRLGMSAEETAAIHAEGQEPTWQDRAQLDAAAQEVPAAAGEPAAGNVGTDLERILLDHNFAGNLVLAGREREGLELIRRTHRGAVASRDSGLALTTANGMTHSSWAAGTLSEGIEAADVALQLAGDDFQAGSGLVYLNPYSHTLVQRALCTGYTGDVGGARRDFERAIEIASECGDSEAQSYAHTNLSLLEADVGELEPALEHATRALELAKAAGNTLGIGAAQAALSKAEAEAGRFGDALGRAARTLAMVRERSIGLSYTPTLLSTMSRSQLRLGEPGAALTAAEEAVEIMEARKLTVCALSAPIALAQVLLATEGAGAGERVEAVLARAMEVARESGARVYEPQIHRELAALARLRGDEPTAQREEAEAARILAKIRSGASDQGGRSAEQMLLDLLYAATLFLGGRERQGLELVRRVNREALASGDPGLALTVAQGAACANWIAGSLREAVEAADRALELAGDDVRAGSGLVVVSPYALALSYRGFCAGLMGNLERARGDLERGIALAREHEDAEAETYARVVYSWLEASLGEIEPALDHAEQAVEPRGRARTPIAAAGVQSAFAFAQMRAGSFVEALERAERTLATIRELGILLYIEPMLLASIARSRLGLDEPDAALAAADEAVEIMDARGLTGMSLSAPIALAQVLIATEGAAAGERIEAVLGRAMEVARESGARVFEPQIHRELAALARLRGDDASAAWEEAGAQRVVAAIGSARTDGDGSSVDRFLLDLNYSGTLLVGGHERDGLELQRRLHRQALASRDLGIAITVGAAAAFANWTVGSVREAGEICRRLLDLAGDDTTAGAKLMVGCPYAATLAWRGVAAGCAGHLVRARSDLERAIAIAREHGDAEIESDTQSSRSWIQTTVGESAPAIESARRALDLSEPMGETYWGARAQAMLALAHAHADNFLEALRHAEPTLTRVRERGSGLLLEPVLLSSIALSRLGLGEPEAAIAAAEEAVEIMEARGLTVLALDAPIALAKVLLATEGDAAGERIELVLTRAMQVARESGARIFEPQIHHELAALARLRGDATAAEREQAEAERILAGFKSAG